MENPDIAMDPLKAGQFVLRGMRNNNLYILTHREYEGIVRDRREALIGSFPRELEKTPQAEFAEAMRRNSIYRPERHRQLCAAEDTSPHIRQIVMGDWFDVHA